MVFAKVVLIVAILVTAGIALLMRYRAWRARREREARAWQAEIDRALERD